MIEIELLPAEYGDCIWLRYGKSKSKMRHVLIDSGFIPTSDLLRKRLHEDPKIAFELFVMTHIDADHIEGSAMLLQDAAIATPLRFKQIWFNGWDHIDAAKEAKDTLGAKQGEYFSALIGQRKIPWNAAFKGKAVVVPKTGKLPTVKLAGGLTLTLLSPTLEKLKTLRSYWVKDLKGKLKPGDEKAALKLLAKDTKYAPDALGAPSTNVARLAQSKFTEDKAEANGSSIAFLAQYDGRTMMFTGDAHPSVLVASLARASKSKLTIDVLKLSHHGSKNNTSQALLDAIKVRSVLVSTSGKKFKHPDPECIARLVAAGKGDLTICFNYASDWTKPWADKALRAAHRYEAQLGDQGSLIVEI